MGIVTRWDDPNKTRVIMEFETAWTWQDLEDALNAIDAQIASVVHAVDIIIDVEGSALPKDFLVAAKNFLDNSQLARDNEGHRVVVGASDLIRNAYQAIQKLFGEKLAGRDILFASDLAQARSMLYSMRLK